MKIYKYVEIIKQAVLCVVAIIFLAPLYISLTIAFKTPDELAKTGLAFPTSFHLTNFVNAIKESNMLVAFKNSTIASVSSAVIVALVCSMAAYMITRNQKNKFYNGLYYIFLAALVLPFQVVMLPLYTNLRSFGLMNIPGYIIANVGFMIAYNVFIMSGFVKSIPVELEEAAYIDGAGLYKTYWNIVFPLLKPIIMTTLVLNILSVWNDFALALIVLQKNAERTLPLAQFLFISQYNTVLGKAFAAFTLSMIPVIILYFFLQKYIIEGITAGAVKG